MSAFAFVTALVWHDSYRQGQPFGETLVLLAPLWLGLWGMMLVFAGLFFLAIKAEWPEDISGETWKTFWQFVSMRIFTVILFLGMAYGWPNGQLVFPAVLGLIFLNIAPLAVLVKTRDLALALGIFLAV